MQYSLPYRDLKDILAERCADVEQTTIWRWVNRYAGARSAASFLPATYVAAMARGWDLSRDRTELELGMSLAITPAP